MSFGSETRGTKTVKLHEKGSSFTGIITDVPSLIQQNDFTTGKPAFWDNGDPKKQFKFPMLSVKEAPCECDEWCEGGAKTADYGSEDDDGFRNLYVPKSGNLTRAISLALKAAGAPGGEPEVGGVLQVTRTGVDHTNAKPGRKPPVSYSATYNRPTEASLAKISAYVSSDGFGQDEEVEPEPPKKMTQDDLMKMLNI
jgi:hypothetical protein